MLALRVYWGVSWPISWCDRQAMRPQLRSAAVCLVFAEVLTRAARANVRITAEGHPASSGLLEIQTSSGSFGSVCGMYAEAASVA